MQKLLWCVCASVLLATSPLRSLELTEEKQPLQRWDSEGAGTGAGTGAGAGSCSLKLKPAGQCGEDDDCPYQVTLPPLTIQLPKQFRLLEKTVKELQSLKETVHKLKTACLEGRQQADQSLQRDSGEAGGPGQGASKEERGDVFPGPGGPGKTLHEMQSKMHRMSASLRNARGQISSLQGRVEEMSLINMQNVEAMVDSRVENITGLVKKLSTTCTNQCAVTNTPQCKYFQTSYQHQVFILTCIAYIKCDSIAFCTRSSTHSLLTPLLLVSRLFVGVCSIEHSFCRSGKFNLVCLISTVTVLSRGRALQPHVAVELTTVASLTDLI